VPYLLNRYLPFRISAYSVRNLIYQIRDIPYFS